MPTDLGKARGIYYRNRSREIVKTEDQPPLTDIDVLGFPSHDKLEKEIYRDPVTKRFPKTMVMGQKACINNCSFCCQPAFFGAPLIRKRSVEHFLEELEWVQKLGFREVMFNDATITADMEWAARLFEGMVSKGIDLTWNCSTRADRVNGEILGLMKRAGCHTIAIGMESTDPGVLKNIRKNITPEQIRNAVSLIRKSGMDSIVFCVIGFPGETRESIETTVDFLKTLDTTYITLGLAVPAPGTDFYRYVDQNGYLLTKDWSRYDPLQKPVFSYPALSAEEMVFLPVARPSPVLSAAGLHPSQAPRHPQPHGGKNQFHQLHRVCEPVRAFADADRRLNGSPRPNGIGPTRSATWPTGRETSAAASTFWPR